MRNNRGPQWSDGYWDRGSFSSYQHVAKNSLLVPYDDNYWFSKDHRCKDLAGAKSHQKCILAHFFLEVWDFTAFIAYLYLKNTLCFILCYFVLKVVAPHDYYKRTVVRCECSGTWQGFVIEKLFFNCRNNRRKFIHYRWGKVRNCKQGMLSEDGSWGRFICLQSSDNVSYFLNFESDHIVPVPPALWPTNIM